MFHSGPSGAAPRDPPPRQGRSGGLQCRFREPGRRLARTNDDELLADHQSNNYHRNNSGRPDVLDVGEIRLSLFFPVHSYTVRYKHQGIVLVFWTTGCDQDVAYVFSGVKYPNNSRSIISKNQCNVINCHYCTF